LVALDNYRCTKWARTRKLAPSIYIDAWHVLVRTFSHRTNLRDATQSKSHDFAEYPSTNQHSITLTLAIDHNGIDAERAMLRQEEDW
jgi:hypothetical protein